MHLQPILRLGGALLSLLLPSRKGQAAGQVVTAATDMVAPSPPQPVEIVTAPVPVLVPLSGDRAAPPLVYSPDDFETAWRTVWGEARNQGDAGMVAVAWVIRNRVEIDLGNDGHADWWGEGVKAVCLARLQFTCWHPGDPNREKLLAVSAADPVAVRCQAAVRAAFDGLVPDPTRNIAVSRLGGATHYYAPAVVAAPKWVRGRQRLRRIGDHDFYRVTD